ncbi:beta-xylosidase [Streptomyces sp. T-3]|nr:beta-xylosidase [Streptomyces sp. T-3]
MPSAIRRRRWMAALGVTALAVGAGGALAPPATALAEAAQQVEVPTRCVPPPIAGIPPIEGPTTADITVDNMTPKVGDTVNVTYKVVKPAASNPVDLALPADIMLPTGKVTVGGVQSGDATVAGPRKNPPVDPKGTFPGFEMTGTLTLTAPGEVTLSPGDYNINTNYIMSLDTPCTVLNPPAPVSLTLNVAPAGNTNPRSLQLGSASGKPGDSVTVTGSKFTAGAEVTVAGRAGDTETADKLTVTADAQGGFSAALPVSDKATTGIVAYEGSAWSTEKGAGPAAYVVIDDTPLPAGSQKLNSSVKAGTLSMTQAGDTVEMSPVDFGQGGFSRGSLQTVTVKDFRGGPAGWSLTGKVTDFTGPGGAKVDASQLGWTPVCATKPNSPSTCAAGSPGAVGGSGATLASTPNGTLTGGEFTVDARVSLKVPEFTPPGSYSGVLTLTLT